MPQILHRFLTLIMVKFVLKVENGDANIFSTSKYHSMCVNTYRSLSQIQHVVVWASIENMYMPLPIFYTY